MSKQYSKFKYAQKKIQFLAELDERLVSQLEWWTELNTRNKETLADMDEDAGAREYYEGELKETEAALDAINDLRAMLEKQI